MEMEQEAVTGIEAQLAQVVEQVLARDLGQSIAIFRPGFERRGVL
jgi:hypothetical protein